MYQLYRSFNRKGSPVFAQDTNRLKPLATSLNIMRLYFQKKSLSADFALAIIRMERKIDC